MQRHFGADVLERFHLEVRRSHPRLYRAEGMLHSLAAHTHLVRIAIEPRLHGLEDGFVFPTRDPALLASRALALQRARLTGGRPIAAQCLAVLLVCITIGQPLTGGTKIDIVLGDIDEVLLAEPPFGLGTRGHRLREIDRYAGLLTGHNLFASVIPAIGNNLDGLRTNRRARLLGHATADPDQARRWSPHG